VAVVSRCATLRKGLADQLMTAAAECVELDDSAALATTALGCDVILVDAAREENFATLARISTPAIALLRPDQRSGLAKLSEKGVRGYLMKPVRQDSLEKRLASLERSDAEPPPSALSPVAPERSAKASFSILVAEDNLINALLARELLRRRGHSVQHVSTGDAAVAACAASTFDLVIMDLHMPGLGGIEAARRIREAEAEARKEPVPIFALTADALEIGREACLAAGMDGFMTKPVDPADLDAVLASLAPQAATIAA